MAGLAEVGIALYYLYFLVGSVSAGYLILRLVYPDVRVGVREEKLGISAMAGAGLAAVAAVIDYVLNPDAFFAAAGSFPLVLFALFVIGLLALKAFVAFGSPKFLEVGVPVPRGMNLPRALSGEPRVQQATPEVVVAPTAISKPVIVSSKERAQAVGKQLAVAQLPPAPAEGGIGRDEEAEKMVLKKAREAELNTMLEELVPKDAAKIVISPHAEDSGARHRIYQLPAEERKAASQAPQSAQKKEDEFGMLVQDVYSQMKAQKTEGGLKEQMIPQAPPKPDKRAGAQQAKPPEQLLSMADLLGPSQPQAQQGAPAQSEESSALFSQLSRIGSGAPAEKKESDVAFVKMPSEQGMGCPRCHAKNSRIVFCPYCGSGMCANCTPLIKPVENGFEYTCPKCGETVLVKKKGAQ